MAFLKDLTKSLTDCAKAFVDCGKEVCNYVVDDHKGSSSHDYELFDSGKKCYLTYIDSGYGKKIYEDQSGQLWCTEDSGKTFYKYKA